MKPGISVLLLFFFTAITTTFVIYPWIMSLVQRMQTFPNQILYFDPTHTTMNSTHITLSVRNLGTRQVTIISASINGQPYSQGINRAILPQSMITIHLDGSYEHGKEYQVELVCDNGCTQTCVVKNG